MTYELAKELKDAGFRFDFCNDGEEVHFKECFPDLSQLIEACGHTDNVSLHLDLFGTHCVARKGSFSATGSTPEEAVARCWLALNK